MKKSGIVIAGNILVDKIKLIDSYPEKGMLTNIRDIKIGVGGCAPNTAIDLAEIDRGERISVIGAVGNDDDGEFVLGEMRRRGIDISMVKRGKSPTSFTDVMTDIRSGERTFFHARGANMEFAPEDIDIQKLDCEIFHIGYILLLDKFDEADNVYGTKLARLLNKIQQMGIKTSIDVVSEQTDRFKKVVTPALKYCDYVILNEIEAGNIVGENARTESGELDIKKVEKILKKLQELGNMEKVVIHCPEGGFSVARSGEITKVGSLKLPEGYIKGAVGAGDSFCAACLYAVKHGFSDEEMLKFASSAAACNLSKEDSVSGMKSRAEIEKMTENFKRRII